MYMRGIHLISGLCRCLGDLWNLHILARREPEDRAAEDRAAEDRSAEDRSAEDRAARSIVIQGLCSVRRYAQYCCFFLFGIASSISLHVIFEPVRYDQYSDNFRLTKRGLTVRTNV